MSISIKPEKFVVDELQKCDYHDCPIIPIERDGKDDVMCLIEAVNNLIGGKRVNYVKISSRTLRSIHFENGYKLTPLCPCCVKTSLVENGNLQGKLLIGLSWDAVVYDETYPALALEFAKTKADPITDIVEVDINSVRTLQKKSR